MGPPAGRSGPVGVSAAIAGRPARRSVRDTEPTHHRALGGQRQSLLPRRMSMNVRSADVVPSTGCGRPIGGIMRARSPITRDCAADGTARVSPATRSLVGAAWCSWTPSTSGPYIAPRRNLLRNPILHLQEASPVCTRCHEIVRADVRYLFEASAAMGRLACVRAKSHSSWQKEKSLVATSPLPNGKKPPRPPTAGRGGTSCANGHRLPAVVREALQAADPVRVLTRAEFSADRAGAAPQRPSRSSVCRPVSSRARAPGRVQRRGRCRLAGSTHRE